MSYNTLLQLQTSDPDRDAKTRSRAKTLDDLGLSGIERDAEFDALAARTAAAFAAELGPAGNGLYAMANLIGSGQQFVGLHNPQGYKPVGRTMRLGEGWCPDVLDRGKALVMIDVFDSARFAGNRVVGEVGIRSYVGAPVGYDGTWFGTVCVIGTSQLPEDTADASWALIKRCAVELADLIQTRTGKPITSNSDDTLRG